MKKIVITLILIWFLPIQILAYSNYIIPGGENIGITINTEGVIIVGFYKVKESYIGKDNLKIGDTILRIENNSINSIEEMTKLINNNIKDNQVNITIERNNQIINTKLNLVLDSGVYKTGLYVKDTVNGIGTLTYIDPITKIYGALGHEIILENMENKVEVKDGRIFDSYVNGIDRSINGNVGSKNASIKYNTTLGTIEKNTNVGLFGKYELTLPTKEFVEISSFEEIENGEATILTTINKNEIKTFKINIFSKDKTKINTSKSIFFEIIDKNLLEESGGIVQGMSGSPIIQNGKIIGAVTHVIVDDVKRGYGVYIGTMLKQGEN